MEFRTELVLDRSELSIAYNDAILLIGSCFSENLGNKLLANKFKTVINPLGTLYDPISIFRVLNAAISNDSYQFNTLERTGAWYAYETHSEIYSNTEQELLALLHQKQREINGLLKQSKYLFITLGTSFVYKLLEKDLLVANCHKQPAAQFQKILLEPSDIQTSFAEFHKNVTRLNSELKLVFTLSPVRHIKDGIENNQISKSILRYCIAKFCEYPNIHYFPSYEFVLDDLRDYRFFKEDLIHPNDLATNYIWEKFSNQYFDKPTYELLDKWQKAKRNMDHKPFNEQSSDYQKHLQSTIQQLENLLPHLDVLQEINNLKLRLNKSL